MEWQENIGKRVVMTLANNLTFAGTSKGPVQMDDGTFVRLELDESSRFCILVPESFIQTAKEVPVVAER